MKPSNKALLLFLLLLLPFTVPAQIPGSSYQVDRRVEELLARMTLEEKIGQLQQYSGGDSLAYFELARKGAVGSFLNVTGAEKTNALQREAVENSRLGIPLIFGQDVIHGYKTIFPIPLAEAASWNPELAEAAAAVAAREARAAGIHWTFAPMVDIARDARWGRIAEGAGEDPYLGSRMAVARVRGFQGEDLAAPDRVAACLKHFVGYGAAEGGRDYNTTEISDQLLRNIYLPPFHAGVRAGAATLMSAFNDINGVPASGNPYTLTRILRQEWGFGGFVVSDWNSVGELVPHGVAANQAEAAAIALKAGVDMDMESRSYRYELPRLVNQGVMPMATIDAAVRRILRIKMLLGLFEHPFADPAREAAVMLAPAHLELALRMARESIVLLKNEDQLLPLDKKVKSIALIGPLSNDQRELLGTWAGLGDASRVTSVLEGFTNVLGRTTVIYNDPACGHFVEKQSCIDNAVALARKAQVVVAILGESAGQSGEASSRSDIGLPGLQQELLEALVATKKPLVVVLMGGRPLALPAAMEQVPAILMAWHGGTRAGQAVADVLFGDYNPGGRLPVSWPRTAGQLPFYYNHKNTGRPASREKFSTGYADLPATPRYPFGYGLSYSKFVYSNLQLEKKAIGPAGTLSVSVELRNSGKRAGDEVVQLYIRDLTGSLTRPVKELKGFQRIALAVGQTTTVRFILGPEELGFWNDRQEYSVEPGQFKIWVGPNSAEGLEGEFIVQ